MLALFKNKYLRKIYISNIISEFGDWIALIAVQTWMVFEMNASVWQISMLFTFSLVPKLIFSPLVGSLIDRGNRQKYLLISRGLAIFVSILFFFAQDINTLILLTAVLNTLKSIDYPATTGIIRNIVKEEEVSTALGFSFLISDVMKILGPMGAAGLVVISNDVKIAFLVNAITFAISFLLIYKLPKSQEDVKSTEIVTVKNFVGEWYQDLLFSLKHIYQSKSLLYAFASIFIFLFSMNAMDASVVVFIESVTQKPEFFALFLSLIGVGGSLGVIITINLQKKFKGIFYPIFNMIIMGSLISIVPLFENLILILILAFIIGMIAPGVIVPLEVYKQTITNKDMSSKIAGFSVSISGLAQLLGAGSAGFLMFYLGTGGAFIASGTFMVIMSFIGLFSFSLKKSIEKRSVQNQQ